MVKYTPSEKMFRALARKGNLIPLVAEISADLETPVTAFLKINKGRDAFLLESVEQGEKLGRYSILGSSPKLSFQSRGTNPLEIVRETMRPYRFVALKGEEEALPRFCGGLVGFIGYDVVRFFEKIPNRHPNSVPFPESAMMLVDHFVVFDHLRRTMKVVALAHVKGKADQAYREAKRKIETLLAALAKPLRPPSPLSVKGVAPLKRLRSNMTKRQFEEKVRSAKRYIRKGDAVQIVLSQRFEIPFSKDPFQVYRALRSINPSPYMFYLRLGQTTLVGSSPEILVQCEKGRVRVRPIAGTRRRGRTEEEDLSLEKELLSDAKERAEHVMLVDLGRNDIGRVCRPGTVRVDEFMKIERYSHVMHMVSEVSGTLRRGEDPLKVLRATFPAGTVTGAPKIRAMEIIDELEEGLRGPYAGCVGYFSFTGTLDSCITIRTILIHGKRAYVQAGAGIVADSKPPEEYLETVNKAKALLQAIAQVGA